MARRTTIKLLAKSLLCAVCGLAFTGCVDDKYDVDSIDLTMGLGSDGLGMTLGATEKIYLGDMLNVDEDDLWHVDGNNLFYLVQNGTTSFDYHVQDVTTKIDEAKLTPTVEVFNFNRTGFSVPVTLGAGNSLSQIPGFDLPKVEAKEDFNFSMSGIMGDIVSLKSIVPKESSSRFKLILEILSNSGTQDFYIKKIEGMKITFPDFIKSDELTGQTKTFDDLSPSAQTNRLELGTVSLDEVRLSENELGMPIENEQIELAGEIKMEGKFDICTKRNVTLGPGSYINVRLIVTLEGNAPENGKILVDLDKVSGVYNPTVHVGDVAPFDIAEQLPDFLKDNTVKIDVANPTIKFNVDLSEVPMSFQFQGKMWGLDKNGQATSEPIYFPKQTAGYATLNKHDRAGVYFYQGNSPYDPDGVEAGANIYDVPNLSKLIDPIPENIKVDMPDGSVRIKQGELNTITLGRDYNAGIDYEIFIPFEFNSKLSILYRDTTDCMKDDLKDYQASGVTVTAEAKNTVPLKLTVELKALDCWDNEIALANPATGTIEAAPSNDGEKTSPFSVNVTFKDPSDLARVDRFAFLVKAAADQPDGQQRKLTSEQFLQLSKILLRLNGQIIGDFN
ncbi:MAG: hypothetical protein PUC38_04900 [Bacteroidales bacterium]|nr:hypothetical protein [Bacteroidales bacterium]